MTPRRRTKGKSLFIASFLFADRLRNWIWRAIRAILLCPSSGPSSANCFELECKLKVTGGQRLPIPIHHHLTHSLWGGLMVFGESGNRMWITVSNLISCPVPWRNPWLVILTTQVWYTWSPYLLHRGLVNFRHVRPTAGTILDWHPRFTRFPFELWMNEPRDRRRR